MLRRKQTPIACGLLMALSTGIASSFAGGPYEFSLIAQTGDQFSAIIGGSLNDSGTIIFDAMDVKDAPGVYDVNADLLDNGHSSTLNDNGDVYFVRHVPVGKPSQLRPAIYQHDIVSVELLAPSSTLVTISQLSATNGGALAFWTFHCCSPAEMCITTRDEVGDVNDLECAGFESECAILAAPSMNNAGHIAYMRQCPGDGGLEMSLLLDLGGSQVSIGNPEDEWLLGAPSLNNDSDLAFMVKEVAEDAIGKIYVRTNADEQLAERFELSGSLRPSISTRVILNDAGDIAFTALLDIGVGAGEPAQDWREAAFVLKNGETDPELVIKEGDSLGDVTLTGDIQVFGFNAAGDLLLRADGEVIGVGTTATTVLVGVVPVAGPTCLGDLNDSGAVDVQDLLILLSSWGPCPGCPADLNDSDAVDVQDLLILLSNWGPCPGGPR